MIIFHHNDLDGRCAAAIAKRGFQSSGRLVCVELDYKDTIPVYMIEVGEVICIVDFSFKPEIMATVLKITSNVFWIDHHKTAAEYDYGVTLEGLRDFTGGNRSGAYLAWEYFFPNYGIPESVKLISGYDTWTDTSEKAMRFMEGMKMREHEPANEIWPQLFADYLGGVLGQNAGILIDEIAKDGKTAILYRNQLAADYRKSFGWETEIAGHKTYALNLFRLGGLAFGPLMQEYPICMAYAHDGKRFTVSLYSETIDVGSICKAQGGGGHKKAAGFICNELPFGKLP